MVSGNTRPLKYTTFALLQEVKRNVVASWNKWPYSPFLNLVFCHLLLNCGAAQLQYDYV